MSWDEETPPREDDRQDAERSRTPAPRCSAWADGEHCFEVLTNRGSKRCSCGLTVKLRSAG